MDASSVVVCGQRNGGERNRCVSHVVEKEGGGGTHRDKSRVKRREKMYRFEMDWENAVTGCDREYGMQPSDRESMRTRALSIQPIHELGELQRSR